MTADADVHPSLLERRVLHVDMDAFYAAIEVRDDPSLAGKPVVVGGSPGGRGVVATASYEARRYGIHSALPAARARRLCPHAIFVRPRMEVYVAESRRVRAILARHSDLIEPLSLDEAYLDVTARIGEGVTATGIARAIRAEIADETGLTASAGVAPNKMLAKIASDQDKPDGLTVVRPERALDFLGPLPARRIPGVGPVTAERLEALGVRTCEDGRRLDRITLEQAFGKHGALLYARFRAIDLRPVEPSREPLSFGHESTFAEDLHATLSMEEVLREQAAAVARRLRKAGTRARTITLKARYPDFTTVTRAHTLERPTDDDETIARCAVRLLARTDASERGVRLLGVSASNLGSDEASGPRQLVFDW